MARRNEDSLEESMQLLSDSPWWVSIAIGLIVYLVARFVVSAMWPDPSTVAGMFAGLASQYAWVSVIFVVPAIKSLFRFRAKRQMLEQQSGIESIRMLPWKQFEELLGEAYRRKGFTVSENPGMGADGGIDLTISRGRETYLVQCKHWKTYRVGVKIVREMLGLVTAHRATGAIVVTSGVFTKEAVAFAANQAVDLVDGDDLVQLIGSVQSKSATTAPAKSPAGRACPLCGRDMVLRQAKRGVNAGGQFYGCSGFPECRHTEAVAG
jgi:restriction system protein